MADFGTAFIADDESGHLNCSRVERFCLANEDLNGLCKMDAIEMPAHRNNSPTCVAASTQEHLLAVVDCKAITSATTGLGP